MPIWYKSTTYLVTLKWIKKKDAARLVYPIQDNIIHKLIDSDDGFRVVQFTKTEVLLNEILIFGFDEVPRRIP